MRELFYRVTAAQMWRVNAGLQWEAHLLIRGKGIVVKGTTGSIKDFPAVLQAAIDTAYLKVTGTALPPVDVQLSLL